jgi:hypothetical protein
MTGSAVWFFALLPGSYGACSGAGSRRTEDKKTKDKKTEGRRQSPPPIRCAVSGREPNG